MTEGSANPEFVIPRVFGGKFVHRELVAPERMVSIVSFTDEKGSPVRHPMRPTWPLEVPGREGMRPGFTGTLDQLAAYLAKT